MKHDDFPYVVWMFTRPGSFPWPNFVPACIITGSSFWTFSTICSWWTPPKPVFPHERKAFPESPKRTCEWWMWSISFNVHLHIDTTSSVLTSRIKASSDFNKLDVRRPMRCISKIHVRCNQFSLHQKINPIIWVRLKIEYGLSANSSLRWS